MLMSNKGDVVIEGRKSDLMAEFTQLVNNLLTEDMFTEDDIKTCIDVAKMSDEELDAESKRIEDELRETIKDDLMKLLDRLFK